MGLRKFTQYIIKELIMPFMFGLCAFSGIIIGVSFIRIIELAQRHGLTVQTILKLLAYDSPEKIALGIPMATLLATLLALGRLSGHSETIAMRASGLSFFRLTMPILFVGLFMSFTHFYLSESVVPASRAAYDQERREATGRNKNVSLTDYTYMEYRDKKLFRMVYAGSFNPASGLMNDVRINEYNEKKLTRTIIADSMVWFDEGWFFQKGEIMNFSEDKVYPLRFDTGYFPSGIKADPKQMVAMTKKPDEMSFWELKAYLDTNTMAPEERRKLSVDLFGKLALPFASFFFALLGAPMGLQTQRRSSSAGLGLSFVFIFIYYLLMGVGNMMGKSGLLTPFLGAWLQNLVLGGYGVYRFIRVKK